MTMPVGSIPSVRNDVEGVIMASRVALGEDGKGRGVAVEQVSCEDVELCFKTLNRRQNIAVLGSLKRVAGTVWQDWKHHGYAALN